MSDLRKPYIQFLLLISIMGLVLIVWSIFQFQHYASYLTFFLLISLAIVGQTVTTSATVSEKAAITYQVTPAIALASVPFYGPSAAILIETVAALSLWVVKSPEKGVWSKSWKQLAFNTGMNAIAMYLAGSIYVWTQSWLGTGTIAGATVPWLVAAITNDQVNLWILVGIIYLQHDRTVSPVTIWRQNLWAVPISILLMTFGGGLLAYAGEAFGWMGIAVFFLPIVFSAYAFRLYIRKAQAHMAMLEKMVDERTAELATSIRRKDALIEVLTHDMITPLTSTQLYSELIKENPAIALENPHLIDIMLHSQNTLLNLVKNILDIERLQNDGTLPLQSEEFDLTQLIRYMVGMVNVLAKEKKIALTFQPEQDPMFITADRQQLERVLLNLLTNAVKHTPQNGSVAVSNRSGNGHIVIEVQDTGYGIPADELATIFDRFHQVIQPNGNVSGTGLGLAITKALIENHNGHITVQSEVGKGSRFTIMLPDQ
jgi:signal transduction histidine kinase